MTDEKEVHQKLGDHGARLKSLEATSKSHDERITKVDERQRRDIRWILTSVIGVLGAMILGVFRWAGEQIGNLSQ
jgi:hypothetical protein